jgi:hypothetical protein
MSDKSPRQSMSKKPGKSLKEKRAIKKSKKSDTENAPSAVFHPGESRPQRT